MKLLFNKFILFILGFFLLSSIVVAKETHSEYLIEVGKIDIGKLFWSINIDETKYKVFIKLEDGGIFSNLYSFNGSYNTEGSIINKTFIPSSYKQKWVTKKKEKNVELYFTNGSVSKLILFPKETMPPKIEFLGVNNIVDPLSSFLTILKNNNSSKTIDGRRFYKMAVTQENLQNNVILKKINIEDYMNIWADHNNNDLSSIQFEQVNDSNEFILPQKIKIKYKGLAVMLSKI